MRMAVIVVGIIVVALIAAVLFLRKKKPQQSTVTLKQDEVATEKDMLIYLNEHWLNEISQKIAFLSAKMKRQDSQTEHFAQENRDMLLLTKKDIEAVLGGLNDLASLQHEEMNTSAVQNVLDHNRTLIIEMYDNFMLIENKAQRSSLENKMYHQILQQLHDINDEVKEAIATTEQQFLTNMYAYGKEKKEVSKEITKKMQ